MLLKFSLQLRIKDLFQLWRTKHLYYLFKWLKSNISQVIVLEVLFVISEQALKSFYYIFGDRFHKAGY